MKKFTFLSVFFLLVSWQVNAQVLNQSANWPNASWTLTGVYNAPNIVAEPTDGTSTTFSFDDDVDSGTGEDAINIESPVIDLTAAHSAGETLLTLTASGYSFNLLGAGETLDIEYFDADASSWVVWYSIPDNAGTSDYLDCNISALTTSELDISGFTATQLSGFQYRVAYDDDGGWLYGFCVQSPTISSAAPPTCFEPTTLTAANITATSADLGWTLSGTETQWNVAVLPDGAPAPTTGDSTVSTNPFTASGLTSSTDYDFYVQAACSNPASLIISGVYDAPLTGGTPKGVELFVVNDIADLSIYGVSSANNGGGATGSPEFTFPAVSATAGTFIYVASEATEFTNFFGFAPDYTDGAMSINGDDAIELFESGSVIDVFGDVNSDGTGQAWEYLDGWAYRNDNESNNGGTFDAANWTFSGVNALDGETSNSTATTPFPIGSLSGPTADVSTWVGPFSFTTLESCPAPTALADSATTSTSTFVYWTTGGATSWVVEYDTAGFTQGTGNIFTAVGTSDTSLGSLSPNTEYDLYVRDFCGVGDSSLWVGPLQFFTGYCQPAPSSVDGDGITNVTFGQTLVVNNSTGTETDNYGDYSAQIGDGAQSTTLNVDITYETGLTYGTEIWVDWNNDLDFDDLGENVYSGVSLSDNPTTLNASFTIPLTAPLGNYRMRIGGGDFGVSSPCYTGTWASIEDYTLQVTAAPACTAPTALADSAITASSASIYWTTGGATSWIVEYDTAGFTQGTGNILTVNSSSDTVLTGLTSNTTYEFYVRDFCGGTDSSAWVGPISFTTLPDYCAGDLFTDLGGLTGDYTNNANDTYVICPDNPGDVVSVNFTAFSAENNGTNCWDGLTIYDGNSVSGTLITPSSLGVGSGTGIWCWDRDDFTPTGSGDLQGLTLISTDPSGCLTFVFTSDGGVAREGWEAAVTCGPPPACLAPSALADSAVTTSSASIYWTTGGASTWIVEYDTAGFTQGTGNILVVNTSADTVLTGLTADTDYEFYVRDFCGVGDSSAWAGPVTFFTGYCQPAPSSVDNDGITNVTFGQTLLVNNTTGTETDNYGDYSAQIGDGQQTSTLDVDITFGTGFTYGTIIWVDWNNDLDFDDLGEEVYTGLSTSDNPTTLNASFTIPATVPLGNYRMRIGGTDNNAGPSSPCYTGSFGSFEDYTLQVTAAPSCIAPTALADSAVTTSSASIYWTTGGASTWIVEYDTAGFTQGTGNILVVNNSSDTVLTGLTADTEYEVYVRDYCGGTDSSAWTGPITFFTGYCQPSSSGSATFVDNFTTTGGSANISNLGTGFTTGGYNDATSNFVESFETGSFDFTAEIVGGTAGFALWVDWNNDLTFDASEREFNTTGFGSGPFTGTVTVPSGTALGDYRMRITTDWNASNPSDPCADRTRAEFEDYTITVGTPPACLSPSALADSAVTTSSASIYWTTGGASTWIVEYDIAGFTQGTGNVLVVNNSSDTVLTGLTADTEYEFYVRDYCGGTDSSAWTGPATFFTGYCQPSSSGSATFVDNFTTTGGSANISNLGTGFTTGGYNDATSNFVESFETGSFDFTAEIVGGTAGFALWVDWNNDLTFDASEREFNTTGFGSGPFTGTVTVPSGTALGDYRMRITTDWNASNPSDPCADRTRAEFEDYTITVGTPPSCLAPSALSDSAVTSTSASIYWTTGGATTWIVEYDTAGFTQGTGNVLVVNNSSDTVLTGLTADTEYDFYVRDYCGGTDSSSWTGPATLFTGYCQVSTTNTGDYLSEITTTGANTNINYTASSQPTNSYADETAQVIESFPGGSFDFSTTYVGGSNGVNIWADLNNDLDFDDVGELVFSQANTSATKTGVISIPAVLPLGDYRVRVRGQFGSTANPPACGNVAWGSTVDFTLSIVAPPACLAPSALADSALTTTSADVYWNTGGSGETEWQIEYDTTGFVQGTGITQVVTDSVAPLSGLTPATTYDAYVRAICGVGDSSTWVGPITFTTLCAPFTATYTQDFDAFNAAADFNNANVSCWTAVGPGANDVELSSTLDFTGTIPSLPNVIEFNDGDLSANDTSVLVSPQFTDLPSGLNRIRFQAAFESATPSDVTLIVGVMTDPNDLSTFVSVDTLDASDVGGEDVFGEVSISLDNTGLIGSAEYIAFIHGPGFFEAYLDDFVYEPIPSCDLPTAVSDSAVTTSSAVIYWTDNSVATDYFVEYGAPGFTAGTGMDTVVGANPFTLIGLDAGTTYEVRVRAICSPTDTSSVLANSTTFTTIATCFPPTSLDVAGVTLNTVDLVWLDTLASGSYQLEYDLSGFAQDTGNFVVVNDTFTTLVGLDAETSYDVYIRSLCGGGDTSAWFGPVTVFTGYCQPAPTSVDGDGITNVTFGQTSVVNNSTFAETNNYGDYSAQIGDGAQSTVVNVDITLETGWEYYTNIWIDWNNDLIFDASELVFDELSTDDNPTTINASFLVPATVALGNYRMRIGAVDTSFAGPITPCYTGAFGTFEDYTLEVTAAPTCLQAVDFGTTNVSGTSVDVYWTDPSGASEYVIEYGLTGFTQGTGTLDTVSNDTVTLTGLTVLEDYDIFVRTVCAVGDTSFTSNFTFNSGTVCDVADIAVEAVNDCVNNTYNIEIDVTDLGDAVTLYITDGTDTLTTITSTGVTSVGPFASGTSVELNALHDTDTLCDLQATLINLPCNDDLCDAQELIVNGDTLSGSNIGATFQPGELVGSCFTSTTDTASVWYSFTAPANGSVTVSTDIAGAGTLTDTQLGIYELNSSDCADVDSLVQVGCDEDGGVNVNFNSVADVTGLNPGETYYVQVDGWGTANGTFSIFVSTDCEIPTNLTATNETETSVDLTWDENGAATSWLVEYGPLGFTQGTGTQVVANANPYTLSGLAEGDSLQYFVKAICSSSDSSAWSLISDTAATLIICNDPTAVTTTDVSPNEVEVSWTDASGATTFEVEYGEAGFVQGTGTVVTVSASPASLTGLDGDTDYDFYVRAACDPTNGEFSNWVSGSFTSLISCTAPYDLVLSNVTDSSVTLAWSDTSGATSWQIEYGTPGFALGTGSTVNASTNPIVVSGLSQNEQYEFYVTSICGLGDISLASDVSNVITTLQTGIISVGSGQAVEVYGNDNTIYMKFDNIQTDVANVKVYNMVGKVIAEDIVETIGTQTLQVDNVAAGIYIVKLELDNVTNTIKVFLTNK